ncbi:disulfide bond formation protein B [Rhodobacteraceae bacterium NNCM2]|nr:disulfide bond formation protein B [Coraliihabitans acroporae]
MTDYGRILLASFGSFALLAGALISQYIGGLAPCPMCLWQRWPHLAAVVIGVIAMTIGWRYRRFLSLLGGLAALATAAIGFFHAGVEQKWWEGPSTCTSAAIGSLSTDEAFARMMQAPMVRCDDIAWQFGLTLAGWNGVFSLILAGLWFWTVYQPFDPER